MSARYDFLISDLLLRIESPCPLHIPDNFLPFYIITSPEQKPDIKFEIIFQAMQIPTDPDVRQLTKNVFCHNNRILERYYWRDNQYIIRCETVGRGEPCRLFIPVDFTDAFCSNGNWLLYMSIGRLLQSFNRCILHASAVLYKGNAYLFTAVSGGGKSTQASLWEKHTGAEIINGDKVIIALSKQGMMAYGGPVAGSSGIYKNMAAPIAAVFSVQKDSENRIFSMSTKHAVLCLYSSFVKSDWDCGSNTMLLDMANTLVKQIPVMTLECLPDESAVEYTLHYLKMSKKR